VPPIPSGPTTSCAAPAATSPTPWPPTRPRPRPPALDDVGPVGALRRFAGRLYVVENEREVLDLVAAGRSNGQITAALYLSPTVR
jgi:hypothetical protein